MLEEVNKKQIVYDLSKDVIKNTIDQIRNMNTDELYETFKTYFVLQKVIFSKIPIKFVFNNDFKESEHPRDEEGKFTDTGAIPDHIRRKIESVKIDFARDNILPELNTEDLEDLGIKSKPVMVSKRMLTRNLQAHPEIDKKDYDKLLSYGLYNADYIFRANREKPSYFHMIAKLPDGKSNSGLIIELSDNKDNFEIVHVTKLKDKSVRRIIERDKNL